jgi:hypothetical protein
MLFPLVRRLKHCCPQIKPTQVLASIDSTPLLEPTAPGKLLPGGGSRIIVVSNDANDAAAFAEAVASAAAGDQVDAAAGAVQEQADKEAKEALQSHFD